VSDLEQRAQQYFQLLRYDGHTKSRAAIQATGYRQGYQDGLAELQFALEFLEHTHVFPHPSAATSFVPGCEICARALAWWQEHPHPQRSSFERVNTIEAAAIVRELEEGNE